jgi:hypothetical protein
VSDGHRHASFPGAGDRPWRDGHGPPPVSWIRRPPSGLRTSGRGGGIAIGGSITVGRRPEARRPRRRLGPGSRPVRRRSSGDNPEPTAGRLGLGRKAPRAVAIAVRRAGSASPSRAATSLACWSAAMSGPNRWKPPGRDGRRRSGERGGLRRIEHDVGQPRWAAATGTSPRATEADWLVPAGVQATASAGSAATRSASNGLPAASQQRQQRRASRHTTRAPPPASRTGRPPSCLARMSALGGGDQVLHAREPREEVVELDAHVPGADDEGRDRRRPGVRAEVAQRVDQPPVPLDEVGVDQDQLDVGRFRGEPEPPVARLGDLRLVAEGLQEAGELARPVDVAVDDDGLRRGLVGDEPGEDRDDPARAGERPARVERDERPRRGELGPSAGGPEGPDERVGRPLPTSALRSVTCPRAVAAGRRGRSCRRRSPAPARRRARPGRRPPPWRRRSTGRSPGRRRIPPAPRPSPAPGSRRGPARHGSTGRAATPRAPAGGRSTPPPRSWRPAGAPARSSRRPRPRRGSGRRGS